MIGGCRDDKLRVGDKEINTNGICVPKKRVRLLWKIIKRNWSKMLVEVWMVKDKECIPE